MESLGSQNRMQRNQKSWDGKLRVRKNEDGFLEEDRPSSPESLSERVVEEVAGGEIDADQDLLEGFEPDETDIDLNHSRISSTSALQLARFNEIERLCLRQNQISRLTFPSKPWGRQIEDLDLYDNLINHIKGIDHLESLRSLDLSFNKIKHIENVDQFKQLENLYFVQNKISKIENLSGLERLVNLELAANRIREIENLEALKSLKELWLGKNKISELKNLSGLNCLTLLSIQSNRLTSSSLGHLSTLPQLEELYISHNQLTSIEPLSNCRSLRVIDISTNPISTLKGLKPLALLEELWASNCHFGSFEEVEAELRDKSNLSTVYFEGNPLEKDNHVTYRHKMMLALPQVKQIDATFTRAP